MKPGRAAKGLVRIGKSVTNRAGLYPGEGGKGAACFRQNDDEGEIVSSIRDGLVGDWLQVASEKNKWDVHYAEYLAETGLRIGSPATNRLLGSIDRLTEFVSAKEPGTPQVYLDTTTIWSASQLAAGNSQILSAETIMDLDKVTSAIILNDKIFHLPTHHVDTNALNLRLGDQVFHPLPAVPGLNQFLWELWYYGVPQVANAPKERREADSAPVTRVRGVAPHTSRPRQRGPGDYAVLDSQHIFNDLVSLYGSYWRAIDRDVSAGGHDQITSVWSSVPASLVYRLINADDGFVQKQIWGTHQVLSRTGLSSAERAIIDAAPARQWIGNERYHNEILGRYMDEVSLLQELLYRALFHQMLAETLGVAYEPSFTRFPAVAHFSKNGTGIALALADIQELDKLLGQRLRDTAQALAEVPPKIPLPSFTAYMLAKCNSVREWWDIVADLRQRASRYRAVRRKLQEALLMRDVKSITLLKEEVLSENSMSFDAKIGSGVDVGLDVIGSLTSVAPGTVSVLSGPIYDVVKALLKAPTVRVIRAVRRRIRPELRLFHDVSVGAGSFLMAENKVRLLWQPPPAFMNNDMARLARYVQRYKDIVVEISGVQ